MTRRQFPQALRAAPLLHYQQIRCAVPVGRLVANAAKANNTGQTWICVSNARQAWQASHAYTTGAPFAVTVTTSTSSQTITSVSQTTFIAIGAYVVGPGIAANTTVASVGASSFIVSNTPTANGSGVSLWFESEWPWPDQVVEESGLGLWQCTKSGTSASVVPTWTASPVWPPTVSNPQPTITDRSVTWALVAYNDE